MIDNRILWLLFRMMVLIYIGCVVAGVISFSLWGQVNDLYHGGSGVLKVWSHPHFLRYLYVYPVYLTSEAISVDPDYIFSIIVSLMVVGMTIISARIINFVYMRRIEFIYILLFIFYVILSLYMNGRLISSLFAMAFLMYLLTRWNFSWNRSTIKIFTYVLLVFLFSSVSSGTFSVIYMIICYWAVSIIFGTLNGFTISSYNIRLLVMLLSALALMLPFELIFINKNLAFYGGGLTGIWMMLEHGMGKIFLQSSLMINVLIVASCLAAVGFYLFLYIYMRRVRPLLAGLVFAILGGVFGYSTLSMLIPPAIMLFVIGLIRFKQFITRVSKRRYFYNELNNAV